MSLYGDYLFFVLIVFGIARAIVATVPMSGRKWFTGTPIDAELERFRRERPNNLTLAGFSLAALTLFLTVGTTPLDPSRSLNVRDTTFYISISLVCFIIAAYLFPIATNRYFSYIADSLELLGLLSIGIGMLLFFLNNFAEISNVQVVYWILFIAVIVIGSLEIYFYSEMFKKIKSEKKN